MRLAHAQGYAGMPPSYHTQRSGLELPFTARLPEAYGVTSERKCLASFSIRFN